ncbi:MAG: PIN domain-containing protein [Gemmatimonadales bacterium]|nr:PIN domain-containing protein [Gemmatimonadales bacterium]
MIVLADTSVWVDHWRRGNPAFAERLAGNHIAVHPFVLGELALGAISPRAAVLAGLRSLPAARVADDDEVLGLIERRRLAGRGIGWVDCHLLASALLDQVRLWTLDRRLARIATEAGAAWTG